MYLRLAARETFQCRDRIKRVRERLRGKLTDGENQNEETVEHLANESTCYFQLKPLNFTGEDSDDFEQKGWRGSTPEQEYLILTDSSIDTSDDEVLLQEVDKFYRNLVTWCEEEEKRTKREGARTGRKLENIDEEFAASPAKKPRYGSKHGIHFESRFEYNSQLRLKLNSLLS